MNLFNHPHRFRARNRYGHGSNHSNNAASIIHSLANTPVGNRVRVVGFIPGLARERRTQLQSYGLAPGQTVKVIQHVPVTVLQIEQFELALEREMAAFVEVTQTLAE